jgi:two-component system, cell cycle sensor histidine kinase and response regulator CckA
MDRAAAGSESRLPFAGGDQLARLTVRDQGVGIPGEMLDRIFDPFFSTKARGRGTGMGLAIAYSIVEQSGGTLTVESTVGAGTVFTLLLPLRDGQIAPAAERPRTDTRALGTGRILLTEDDESVRQSTQRMLTQAGYTVITAPNGPVALERFEQAVEPFDLLLSDVVMPGMSGSELARRLRERQPDLAVLYMSGYADDEHLHDTLASSDTVCIPKPFTMQTLLDATRRALAQRVGSASDVSATA